MLLVMTYITFVDQTIWINDEKFKNVFEFDRSILRGEIQTQFNLDTDTK